MKRVSILVSALCACPISMSFAQMHNPSSFRSKFGLRSPRMARFPNSSLLLAAQPPRWPSSVTSNTIPTTCPPEAAGAVCGYVKVPLDRDRPNLI
jgi:hypothetical protein